MKTEQSVVCFGLKCDHGPMWEHSVSRHPVGGITNTKVDEESEMGPDVKTMVVGVNGLNAR